MKKGNIFWGLFFILGAVILITSRMGFLPELNFITVFLGILLAACLVESVIHFSISGILFSLAFLCIVFSDVFGLGAITPWPVLGAALLGSIGCSILFPKKRWSRYQRNMHGEVDHEHFDSIDDVNGGNVIMETSFGAAVKYVKSDNFQNADVRCSFGAMKVYFDDAIIQGDSARVNVDISFSGVELYVPKTWRIEDQVETMCGGVEEKGRYDSTSTKTLYVTGNVKFAGLDIRYI